MVFLSYNNNMSNNKKNEKRNSPKTSKEHKKMPKNRQKKCCRVTSPTASPKKTPRPTTGLGEKKVFGGESAFLSRTSIVCRKKGKIKTKNKKNCIRPASGAQRAPRLGGSFCTH